MGSGLYFPICSFFYSLLLVAVFIFRKHINTLETKIYSKLVIINFIGLILEIICSIGSAIYNSNPIISNIIFKSYLLYNIFWFMLLTLYVYIISQQKTEKDELTQFFLSKYKKFKYIIILICLLVSLVVLILPIYLYNEGMVRYTYGPSVSVTYSLGALLMVLWVIFVLINFKNIKNKKYIPIYICILGILIVTILQFAIPGLLIMTYMQTLVTFIMYFTIENPDMKMVAQLNIARDQAERANQAKTEFLSSMSHEIRTPLNAITGFSQILLEDESIPSEAQEEVKDIVSASESLLEIVNGILDISKIEANKIELINSEYKFNKIIDELVPLVKVRIGDKPIDLRVKLDPTIPNVLYGDSSRIKQIILNLLTNAAKYTKEGYIEFKVSSIIKDGICRLIISVQDTGIGIKKENIDKLFTKFERLEVERNTTAEGTGLGLAITKQLVELMGGKIVVQSVYGVGSRFTVSIDQKISEKENLEETKAIPIVSLENFDGSAKKVLIVDDNNINLKVAARLLKTYNINTEEVVSGFEAIEKIKTNTYDLIFMDDMMPKMSGIETLKKLKETEGFNIPVVALTANAIAGMKEKYIKEGFNDYLSKPIQKVELSRIIKKFLS